ncbi:MFS transporter, DHA1 family, multidrug resistance protein [Paenibacillus polysaccharolyticus]|uniref:MFS transporter, DHA1 family, multidrug resistance protein n=1 Tax=Paenibacillus polysaccharolyticus TaxID=582692 RepID=A0A1G5CUT2_9BACL|nr:MFS transporter [Paenibacillus polysaccharolyticus]SCY06162.1 MFS transporter, DHA1 family, multidrug resistance protein [Paenibacillus polysaccharolyticus]
MRTMTQSTRFPMFILMLNLFIALLGQGMLIPILPEYLKLFHAGGTVAGFLVAAFGAAQFLFSPLGGQWADRFGRKKLIMAGMFLVVVSDLIFAVSTSLPLLYIARFIGGISLGLMVPANLAYVADITTPETRAKGMGYFGASMNLGMVLGPGLGGFIAEMGVRMPYFVASGLGLVAAMLTLLLPETLPPEKRTISTSKKKGFTMGEQIWSSFKVPYFGYLLIILVMTFGLMSYETVFSLFAKYKYGFNASTISVIITMGAIIGIVIQIWLLDFFVKRLGEIKLIRLSLIMTPIALLLMLIKVNLAFLLFASALYFAFNAFLRPTVSSLISKSAGDRQGYASGLNTTYSSLGTVFGPLVAGLLFDKNVNFPYIFGAFMLLAALSLTMSAQRSRKGKQYASE